MFRAAAFAVLLFGASCARAVAACDAGGPAGRYEGIITSAQAGKLDVILNLRCADGHYRGILVTPVGKFPLKDGRFESGALILAFDGGGGTTGTLTLARGGQSLHGSFALQDDHGPVTLARAGNAAQSDSFEPTLMLSPALWREDLAYFARELPRRHANAFHRITRGQFEAAVARLNARIGRLNGDEMYFELDRLATMIGDGHTYVIFPPNDANLPLDIGSFAQTYRVTSVVRGYEVALGATVTAIDGTPIAEARRRLIEVTPRDETQALREGRVETFLTIGMMLHGAGIARSRDSISFALSGDSGRAFSVTVKALAPGAHPDWVHVYPKPPLFRQHPGEPLWCTTPRNGVVYCNFRGYDGLDEHAKAMFDLISRTHPGKLIIDMRGNSGGDFNQGLKYVVGPIAADASLNRRGHLFVLTDEAIFSAGMSNTAQFRSRTRAVLVGEAIGERPNTYQEAREMMLPNSHLVVRYSTRFYRFVADGENIVRPDVEVATSWNDYRAGRDPVLAWALSH